MIKQPSTSTPLDSAASSDVYKRQVIHDRVRVAQGEHHLATLQLGAVADADDIELALEALGHACHGVGHEAPAEAVELAEFLVLADGLGEQLAVMDLEGDAGRERLPQFALRALDLDGIAGHVDRDALRDRNRFLSNTRHDSLSKPAAGSRQLAAGRAAGCQPPAIGYTGSTKRYRAPRRRCPPWTPRGRSSARATSSGC